MSLKKSQTVVIRRRSRIEEVLGKEHVTKCVPAADHDDTPFREKESG